MKNIIILYNFQLFFRILETFDEMSFKINTNAQTVPELMQLISYVNDCRDNKMFNLKEEIRKSGKHLLFLMDSALLSSNVTQKFKKKLVNKHMGLLQLMIWP